MVAGFVGWPAEGAASWVRREGGAKLSVKGEGGRGVGWEAVRCVNSVSERPVTRNRRCSSCGTVTTRACERSLPSQTQSKRRQVHERGVEVERAPSTHARGHCGCCPPQPGPPDPWPRPPVPHHTLPSLQSYSLITLQTNSLMDQTFFIFATCTGYFAFILWPQAAP